MGQVFKVGPAKLPARQTAIYAGVNNSTPCMTINKVCGSGMKAVMLAADMERFGVEIKFLLLGSGEHESHSHLLPNHAVGYKWGKVQIIDSRLPMHFGTRTISIWEMLLKAVPLSTIYQTTVG